jgi:epoxyqueuosine reductase
MDRAYEELRVFCEKRDAVGFGVVELARIRTDDFLLPEETLERYDRAISVAMKVSDDVLATILDHPNRLYEHHYRQVNFALDRLGLALSNEIKRRGYHALPIAASQLVDWDNQRAHVSHKRIAVGAGLGWLGRNNLVVMPEHGAQVRLATVLTDMPLPVDLPLEQDCGECRDCIAACPAAAIKDTAAEFDHHACFELLKEFQKKKYVSQYICGVCVKACAGQSNS